MLKEIDNVMIAEEKCTFKKTSCNSNEQCILYMGAKSIQKLNMEVILYEQKKFTIIEN